MAICVILVIIASLKILQAAPHTRIGKARQVRGAVISTRFALSREHKEQGPHGPRHGPLAGFPSGDAAARDAE